MVKVFILFSLYAIDARRLVVFSELCRSMKSIVRLLHA